MKPDIDVLDIVGGIGLALLGWGFWQIWQPLAPLATGAIIVSMVLLREIRE